ncbi:PEP-CTERM sorting domain-containing protein [Candidatus Nitrospira bockiana]
MVCLIDAKKWVLSVFTIVLLALPHSGWAGSIFLTGHDPDFHAQSGPGENPTGAQKINQVAVDFISDPAFNPFTSGTSQLLFVESKGSIPGGHRQGALGMNASGITNYVHHDFTTLNAALDQLGTTYHGIVVASDFGGILRQAELDILNARSGDIINFLNAGGGIYAMAQSNNGAQLTPGGGHFGFLPFIVTSTSFNQTETGITVTPFGQSLGLSNADVNGNFSHNVFTNTGGLNIVDVDQFGNILSLAGRGRVDTGGVTPGTVPEPTSIVLLGSGLVGFALWRRKRWAAIPMKSLKVFVLSAAIVAAAAWAPSGAWAAAVGPTPYLSFADSPFNGLPFGYFHLETFEDHALNTPGVTGSPGGVTSIVFGPSIHDSVDADDGLIDGSGLNGDSYFHSPGSQGVTFAFDQTVLGSLPTHAGIVWTDGAGTTLFEAFDASNVSLGTIGPVAIADGSFNGETAEDRFFGWVHAGGISKIVISNASGGIEVDHLQYGGGVNGPAPVPEPSAWLLLASGLAGLAACRTKKG